MKKLLVLAFVVMIAVAFTYSPADSYFEWRYPGSAAVGAYMNSTTGYQTYVLINHQDTDPDWGPSPDYPNVYVRFNPKCGRGNSKDVTLTTKQSWVLTPDPVAQEGWVEVFIKTDIQDESQDDDYPLMVTVVILDIANSRAYALEANTYYSRLCVDGTVSPLFYGWNCAGTLSSSDSWGYDADNPIVSTLYRPSTHGSTMVVLLDPNGRHVANPIPAPPAPPGWAPADLYVGNMAELDLYSKSETSSHVPFEWCDGDDAGLPGIITVGVGTTAGPLGTCDAMIPNPGTTMNDAAYGFAQAYNLRPLMWVDADGNGFMNVGEERDEADLLGATLTVISPTWTPNAIDAQQMVYKYY
jgi:hypothetical protein